MAALIETFSYFWTLVALGGVYTTYTLLRFGSREKHLPPGPPTYPIIGNAHLVVDKNLYRKFKDWSDQYGPIFSLKIGKGTMIVLNNRKAVYDLIDKRSAIYSARPQDPQYHAALKGENIANMDADAGWRAQRKITARFFAPHKLNGEQAKIAEAEVTTLMHDLLVKPKNFSAHIDRATASFSSIALFGQRATTNNSFWATSAYEAMDAVNAALSPGSYPPTEQFPILSLIPRQWLASTARAEAGFSIPTRIWTEARVRVETRRASGDKRDSLMDELLDDESVLHDEAFAGTKLANFVGALMQAAAETSALTMRTSILFLAKNMWVQERAWREIDGVCGTERMPEFKDFEKLPWVNCVLKEGLRIRPVVPTGIPHRCTEDNWYEGMLIPKHSTIMIPHYSLHHTPSLYSDPDTYNPTRFLSFPGLATEYTNTPDRDHFTYGAGRRICAGIHLAERTQWRMLARLLWGFRIEPDADADGSQVELDTDAYEEKLIAGPKKFGVRFVVRSERHAEVIREEVEQGRQVLGRWE